MKKFIKKIEKEDQNLTLFFKKTELSSIEKSIHDLDEQHQEIISNLKEVNYLLELIEKHQIKDDNSTPITQKEEHRSNWLTKVKEYFERVHLLHTDKLTADEIVYLQKEKSKLIFEKAQIEKEHHLVHHLIVKAKVYLIDVRNIICKEITKGYDVASVGEKLLEHFGKKIEGKMDYDIGRRKVVKKLESTFSINKIQAKKVFDILEKSKVLKYKIDISNNIVSIPDYANFYEFTDLNYTPLFGTWYINA